LVTTFAPIANVWGTGVGGGPVVAGQFETEITGMVPDHEKFTAHPAGAMTRGGSVTFTTPAVVVVAGGVAAVGAADACANVGAAQSRAIRDRNFLVIVGPF